MCLCPIGRVWPRKDSGDPQRGVHGRHGAMGNTGKGLEVLLRGGREGGREGDPFQVVV